jgi:hypothetical protein
MDEDQAEKAGSLRVPAVGLLYCSPCGHCRFPDIQADPFDYAGPEGPQRSAESELFENKIIGLCWAVIDYDDVTAKGNNGFWNLSRKHTMYGNASQLCAFKLMPLEPAFRKAISAQWSCKVVDMDRRLVAFKDLSEGKISSWKWDFGDGTKLTNQLSAAHAYSALGVYMVRLTAYHESYPTGVSATVTVHVVEPPVHYVAANSLNPLPPYSSWATAAANIQDAVDAATVPVPTIRKISTTDATTAAHRGIQPTKHSPSKVTGTTKIPC